MSSCYFKIEIYGSDNYGCPDFDLMGYDSILALLEDCWDYYHQEHSEEVRDE